MPQSHGMTCMLFLEFLHVLLHRDDRNFTCFFWLTDPTNPFSQFRVVPLQGCSLRCYQFTLYAVLQYHLRQHQSNLYVDNIICGCETEQAVVNYYREARSIMSSARFIRSWSSNSAVLKTIAIQDNTADTDTLRPSLEAYNR